MLIMIMLTMIIMMVEGNNDNVMNIKQSWDREGDDDDNVHSHESENEYIHKLI